MPDDARLPARAVERWLVIGKDLFALLRDGSLFVLAALLLFFPKSLNDVLTSAGFEETFGGGAMRITPNRPGARILQAPSCAGVQAPWRRAHCAAGGERARAA